MSEVPRGHVAVYIDFDDLICARYTQLHGQGSFEEDRLRNFGLSRSSGDKDLRERFSSARVDLAALFDFAATFGELTVRRAYADWSLASNAYYQQPLTTWAVELAQLFGTGESARSGASIRLAVDVMDDLSRLPDISHVVIVAGDSAYGALAQRVRMLGRKVVGVAIGQTHGGAAFDGLVEYDELGAPKHPEGAHVEKPESVAAPEAEFDVVDEVGQRKATNLLVEVLEAGHAQEGAEWLFSATVKNRMLQLDATFDEAKLGYRSFTGFMKSREAVAELIDEEGIRKVKLRA